MRSTAAERDRGYRAAEKIIGKLLEEANRVRPSGKRRIDTRSAAYRAGRFQGLATAHAMLALGAFPLVPSNAYVIGNALVDEDAAACRSNR